MIHKIQALGAFDRFNYGDLLFPLVLEQQAPSRFSTLSLSAVDASKWGGIDTGTFDYRNSEGAKVLVAGGDALSARWFGAYWQIHNEKYDFLFKALYKLVPTERLDDAVKKRFKTTWVGPYAPSSSWYHSNNTLSYNAVGCSDLLTFDEKHVAQVRKSLASSAFVSVRDSKSHHNLSALEINSSLAPDSVAGLDFGSLGASPRNGNAIFQCSNAWLSSNWDTAISVITDLQRRFGRVDFLPIGIAGGHSDFTAANRLRAKGLDLNIMEVHSVSDVSRAIGASAIFIGSSLHGHITAVALSIPSVALPGISKLHWYRETWTKAVSGSVAEQGVKESTDFALQTTLEERQEAAIYCADLARRNTELATGSLL